MDIHFRARPMRNVLRCTKYQRKPSGTRFTVSTNRAPKPHRYPIPEIPNMAKALRNDASRLKMSTM
jgi:hypothetical protein